MFRSLPSLALVIGLAVLMNTQGPVLSPVAAQTAAAPVRCEGTYPILYEHARFGVPALRLVEGPQSRIYASDEETFSNRASAICIPTGYRVTLYDETELKGASIKFIGPLELNLHLVGWGDRTSSVMVERLAAPISTVTAPGIASVNDSGNGEAVSGTQGPTASDQHSPADAFTQLSKVFEAARTMLECRSVFTAYRSIRILESSTERVSAPMVEIGGRMRRPPPTVGRLAVIWRREMVHDHQPQCFATTAIEIERTARMALISRADCQVVQNSFQALESRRTDTVHVPAPWSTRLNSRDATRGDLAGYYIARLSQEARRCLNKLG